MSTPAAEASPPESVLAAPVRLRSLDGLRGAAAVVVLLHHTLLTIPVLAGAYYGAGPIAGDSPVAWLFTFTPLHAVWAGSEAVDLFFLISGLVLTLPALGRSWRWWPAYYARRLTRLYVPVVAAVGFGYLLVLIVPRRDRTGLGAWIEARPDRITGIGVIHDLTLVDGVSHVISTLWSLQWEVQFSLLLPFFVFLALSLKRVVWIEIGLLSAAVLVGGVTYDGRLIFLPIFAVGVAMAVDLERLAVLSQRMDALRYARAAWIGLGTAALLLLTSYWSLQAVTDSPWLYAITRLTIVAGAAGLVFVAAFAGPARRMLENRAFQWLGAVSFSLYLVHEPVVIGSSPG